MQVFMVPASQKIMELRQAISCSADQNMASLGLQKKAAFFFMEGIFYVDKRDEGTDLVQPIKKFCKDQGVLVPAEVGQIAEAMPVRLDDVEGIIFFSWLKKAYLCLSIQISRTILPLASIYAPRE